MTNKADKDRNTAGIPHKSQESYPGPRQTKQAPTFVKEWEHEPTKRTDGTDLNSGQIPQHFIHSRVRQIIKEIDYLIEDLQISVHAEQIYLRGKVQKESIKSAITIELNKQIKDYEVFNLIEIVD